jgi:hypothetical protein
MTTPDDGTQRRRVLAQLVKSGATGITSADFGTPRVIDGGKPIARLAARIEELRRAGVEIASGGRRGKLEVYVLADASSVPDLPPRLFEDVA